MADRKLISVVTPCYNEVDNIQTCYEVVRDLFAGELPGYDHEHIFCDNASTDGTVEKLRQFAASDPNVKVILNSRNFGPDRSLFNGIIATRGDAVLLFLPADLQDPPELIPEFVKKWEEGHEVVQGVRKKREEGLVMALIRRVYYRLVNRLAKIGLPENVGDFQLVDRKIVDALRHYDDYYPYLRGMVVDCGFESTAIDYTWKRREHGKSKANWFSMMDIALNAVISYSKVPMRLCMFSGFFISLASILYAMVSFVLVVLDKLFWHGSIAPSGTPTLIIALFFFSGVQLFFLGILGEYVCAIHSQVRKGPLIIERERINF